LQLVEGLGEAGGKAVVGHLDEQVAEAVDAEARGVALGVGDVVEGEMEVAAAAERERDARGFEAGTEFGGPGGVDGGIEYVMAVGVR